jgi:hypothetical protein
MPVKRVTHKDQMAKKKSTNAATSWVPSEFKQADLTKAQKEGFLVERDQVVFPSSERIPKPPSGYRVMFFAFLLRGLSLPTHEFLCGLLLFMACSFISSRQTLFFTLPASLLFLNLFSWLSPIGLCGNSFSASTPAYPYRRTLNWAGLLFLCVPSRII